MNYQQFLTYSPEVGVAGLYQENVQGVWYDPSNLSTLYQDSALTTPVTAVEQFVGGMLDLSGRGNHALQATPTKRPVYSRRVNALNTTQTVLNGTVTAIPDAFGPGLNGIQATRTIPGDEVYLPMNPSDVMGGSKYTLKVYMKKGGQTSSNQVCSFYTDAGGCIFAVDWSSGAISYGSATGGFAVTNHSSVKLSADSYYVTVDCAVPANVTSVTLARIYFWTGQQGAPSYIIGNPQFSLATDAHLPYQWVNTATDYDADPAKFPAYLRFDGVDDALQAGNIDFTGTDKMTVWAGVDKVTGPATGVIVETSGSFSSNNGAFALLGYGTLGFEFASRGTALSDTVFNSSPPASPSIVTASFDIGGGSVVRRVNSQQSAITANQGTGQYGNYPFYIGGRSAASIFFNGRLYSLIVRGAQTNLSQIEAAERYIKQKMRMP